MTPVVGQVRDERRQAQVAVAANAKTLLRKETEWMRQQPKPLSGIQDIILGRQADLCCRCMGDACHCP